jgi:hypothetical protein
MSRSAAKANNPDCIAGCSQNLNCSHAGFVDGSMNLSGTRASALLYLSFQNLEKLLIN